MPASAAPLDQSTSFATLRRQLPVGEGTSAILYFAPLWGLFEQVIFNKDFDSKQVKAWTENVYAHPIEVNWLNPEFVYFRNRYRLVGRQLTPEWIFKLGFYGKGRMVASAADVRHEMITDDGQRVEFILGNGMPTIAEKIEALVLIIHRIRNNFFHGEKDLYEIAEQTALLERCNAVLSRLIDDFRLLGCELQNVARPPRDRPQQNVSPRVIKVARRRSPGQA